MRSLYGIWPMSSVSLGRMLTLFRPVYESIDIRIACLREDSTHWKNVITVVRFSDENDSALRARLDKLVTELGVIADDKFRIVVEARPFSEWQTLNMQFTAGEVHVGDLTILYPNQQDLELLTGSLMPYWQYAKKEREGHTLEVYTTSHTATPESVLRAHDSIALRAGFHNISEAISSLLQTKFDSGVSTSVIALAPALAELQIRDLDPNTGDLVIATHIPKQLDGCQLNILVRETDMGMTKFKTVAKLSTEKAVPTNQNLVEIISSLRVGDLQPQAWIDATLVIEEIELFRVRDRIERHFTKTWLRVAPLYDVFRRFDGQSNLREMLLKPQQMKVKIHGRTCRPDELFERSICWLMSFLGFSSIKMDERERLREQVTSTEIGSVDILAYHETEGVFLIANCSLMAPGREAIQRMRNAAKTLSEDVLKGRVRRVRVAYFTLDENLHDLKKDAAMQDVTIYERGDIEGILNNLLEKKSTLAYVL